MKSKITMAFIILTVFFSFNLKIEAKNVKKYVNVNNSKFYVNIDKDQYTRQDDKSTIVYNTDDYSIPANFSELVKAWMPSANIVQSNLKFVNNLRNLFTGKNDQIPFVVKYEPEKDKWWSSIYVCREVKYSFWDSAFFNDYFKDIKVVIYTDSLISEIAKENNLKWYEYITGGTDSSCETYRVQGVEEKDKIYSCTLYDDIKGKIETNNNEVKNWEQLKSKYKKLTTIEKTAYINSYNNYKSQIKSACKQAFSYATYSDGCVNRCLNLNDDIKKWNSLFDPSANDSGECGLSGNLIKWIKNILKWIKYILPALVIILGILDFIKAIASGSDDEMKKAQGRFIKRLIAAALLFIVPALIEFLLNIFHIESSFCGIVD